MFKNRTNYTAGFLAIAVSLTVSFLSVSAETISSENYIIEGGRVGTGEVSIPYAQSENYAVGATSTPEKEKKIDVELENDVKVGDGLVAEVDQDIDEITITGSYDDDKVKYDLEGLGTFRAAGEDKIRIEDLDLPGNVEVVSNDARDTVATITISEQQSAIATIFEDLFGGDEGEGEGEGEGEEEGLPAQLFDINLEIDEANISSVHGLAARVVFTSFGTESTPVDLTFVIIDEAGNEVYRDEGEDVDIVVETEAVYNKSFNDAPDLPYGKYTLVLTTLYNTDVKDEFKADFEIREPTVKNIFKTWWFWLASSIITALALWLVIKIGRRKKRDGKSAAKGKPDLIEGKDIDEKLQEGVKMSEEDSVSTEESSSAKATEDEPEDKPEDGSEDEPEDELENKPEEMPEDKSEDKTEDKPEDKLEDRSEDKSENVSESAGAEEEETTEKPEDYEEKEPGTTKETEAPEPETKQENKKNQEIFKSGSK